MKIENVHKASAMMSEIERLENCIKNTSSITIDSYKITKELQDTIYKSIEAYIESQYDKLLVMGVKFDRDRKATMEEIRDEKAS